MAVESHTPLKRLGFVHTGANLAYSATGQAEKLYKSVRSLTPGFIEPTLSKVEDIASAYTAPVITKAQDAGEKLLHFADDQVDYVLKSADHAVSNGKSTVNYSLSSVKELHDTNLKTFSSATERYFELMTKTAEWAATKLNPVTGVQVAYATFKAAVARAKELTDPDVAVAAASKAWSDFAAVPAVSKVLDTAEPATNLTFSAFYKLHDTLVTLPLYKKAVDTSAATAGWASGTLPYRLGANYLYPIVQPVADPALSKVTNSKVIQSTLDYWKPSAKPIVA